MRGAAGQVLQFAKNRFPEMEVAATPYPVPAWKVPIVRAAQGVQFGALAMVFAGDKVFQYLNVPPPAWYTQNVAANRFGYAMGVWFFGNTVVTNLQNTGAFEVYFDGQLVFSKLAQGRMPTMPELMGPVEAYFRAQQQDLLRHGAGAGGRLQGHQHTPEAVALGTGGSSEGEAEEDGEL